MTLAQVLRYIEYYAGGQPAVSTIVRNDIFRLNGMPSVSYGVFAWLQNQHTTDVDSDFIHYNFTFFYADRLTASRSNEIEVQSVGMQVLENVLRWLREAGIEPEGSYQYKTFNQRFADECAGVFVTVTLSVPKGDICADHYGDSLIEPEPLILNWDDVYNLYSCTIGGSKTFYII